MSKASSKSKWLCKQGQVLFDTLVKHVNNDPVTHQVLEVFCQAKVDFEEATIKARDVGPFTVEAKNAQAIKKVASAIIQNYPKTMGLKKDIAEVVEKAETNNLIERFFAGKKETRAAIFDQGIDASKK